MTTPVDTVAVPQIDYQHIVTEDDTPVDTILSEKNQRLLTSALYASWAKTGETRSFVATANVGLFYQPGAQPLVPDVLVSLDVQLPEDLEPKKHRSYFIWEYGKPPDVVIEIVSNREGGELDRKVELYARMRVAYYVVFDPFRALGRKLLRVYELQSMHYVERRDAWLPGMKLGLMLWQGMFEDKQETWLRWVDRDGNLLLTGTERAKVERQLVELEAQRAEAERQRADAEAQRAEVERERADAEAQRAEVERERADAATARAERLAAQLRALGLDSES